jgi:hypothetical protein
MNLAIRGIDGKIEQGDTFHNDRFPDLKADFILANPPFHMDDWGSEAPSQRQAPGVWPAARRQRGPRAHPLCIRTRSTMSTPHYARYFAFELSRIGGAGTERLSRSLFNACVDLNPHQMEAALFAVRSPISRGVLLADEVGHGKTIEAGLIPCQFPAEKRRPATPNTTWG